MQWFNATTNGGDADEEGAHVILKYRADLCYHRQQLHTATSLYLTILEVRHTNKSLSSSFHEFFQILPASNRVVKREVMDSLLRCHLRQGEYRDALRYAAELLAPPHDNDASSWQLMALCHRGIGRRDIPGIIQITFGVYT